MAKDVASDPAGPKLLKVELADKITPMVILAVTVGLALIALAIFDFAFLHANGLLRNAVVGLGIALILTAFGGQGTAQYKGLVLAGVSAICFALVAFLEYSEGQRLQQHNKRLEEENRSFVRGFVENLPLGEYRAGLKFGDYVLGTQADFTNQYDFIAFKDEVSPIDEAHFYVSKSRLNRDTDKVEFAEYATFDIPKVCFESRIGSGKRLQWKFVDSPADDQPAKLIEAGTNKTVALWPKRDDSKSECSTVVANTSLETREPSAAAWYSWLMSPALAGGSKLSVDAAMLRKALSDLNSGDVEIRRRARDILSMAPIGMVPQILGHLRANARNYRVSLGISVALTEMLRRDKALGARIDLSPADINVFLTLASDDDRTLRVYAGEFLHDLGSPMVAKAAIERAAALGKSAAMDNARFNLIFIAQNGWKDLPPATRKQLAPQIETIRRDSRGKDRTLELLKKLPAF